MNFDKHIESSRLFLKALATELGNPEDLRRANRVLRSVFVALRQRLSLEESFDLIANFPLLIKGLYVEGWRPSAAAEGKIKTVQDLAEIVLEADKNSAARDFGNIEETKKAISSTFHVIKESTSLGQTLDISATLPKELKEFWITA